MNRPRKTDKHLPRCVYLKHGRYWYVKRGKWTSLGVTLQEALAAYARVLAEPVGGMADLIDRAMPVITHGKSDATREQYAIAARKLKRALVEFSPGQVKPHHMAKLRDSMLSKPNMANRVITVARLIFAKALSWGEVESNPCTGLERLAEKKRERLFTSDEWHAIHAKAGPRLQVIMELQALTGQRITDVLRIRRSQLTEAGIEFVQQKTKAKVLIGWTPELRATVEKAKGLTNTPALTLLRGKYGKAPDYRSVALQWREACIAAGVPDARLNDGRAMAATNAKAQGKDATALLGHTSEAMTRRYLRGREAIEAEAPTLPKRR